MEVTNVTNFNLQHRADIICPTNTNIMQLITILFPNTCCECIVSQQQNKMIGRNVETS